MRTFWKVLGTAAVLSAVTVAMMAAPKRPVPQKPELVTFEINIGGNKLTVTGTPVERFDEPRTVLVNRAAKGDKLVRADGEPMEERLFHTAETR